MMVIIHVWISSDFCVVEVLTEFSDLKRARRGNGGERGKKRRGWEESSGYCLKISERPTFTRRSNDRSAHVIAMGDL